ncbi:MAG TPA: ankyrin repeat domain-containing protein [Rickettsia endosymbiont of Pyrocoelia pectoralis]|nr:ankyrin repeat domain-containing protein [Rickettsia endosymbiont of Pyrocoelia pectoralis]
MLKILESFFENKARIQIDRFKQLPPLHSAVKEGNVSEVMICLYRGHNINEKDVYGKIPLDYVNGNEMILEILCQHYEVPKLG